MGPWITNKKPCCVCGKTKSSHPDVRLHLFPTDSRRRMDWLRRINVAYDKDTKAICEDHFDACYVGSKGRLLPNALPRLIADVDVIKFEHLQDSPISLVDTSIEESLIPTHLDEDMATPEPAVKKMRRPNFTSEELLCLVQEVKERRQVIFAKIGALVSQAMKDQAWEEITAAVNQVSYCNRTKVELKKKFKDMKSNTKCKMAEVAKQMQDGEAKAFYTRPEEVILQLMHPASITGLPLDESEAIGLEEVPECTGDNDLSLTDTSPGDPTSTAIPMSSSGTESAAAAAAAVTTSTVSSTNTTEPAMQNSSSVLIGEPVVLLLSEQRTSLPAKTPATNTSSKPSASGQQQTASGRPRKALTAPSSLEGLESLPDFLRVQKDMRDLLGNMAKNFEEFLQVKREAVVTRQEDVGLRDVGLRDVGRRDVGLRDVGRRDLGFREATLALREAAGAQSTAAASLKTVISQLESPTSIKNLKALLQRHRGSTAQEREAHHSSEDKKTSAHHWKDEETMLLLQELRQRKDLVKEDVQPQPSHHTPHQTQRAKKYLSKKRTLCEEPDPNHSDSLPRDDAVIYLSESGEQVRETMPVASLSSAADSAKISLNSEPPPSTAVTVAAHSPASGSTPSPVIPGAESESTPLSSTSCVSTSGIGVSSPCPSFTPLPSPSLLASLPSTSSKPPMLKSSFNSVGKVKRRRFLGKEKTEDTAARETYENLLKYQKEEHEIIMRIHAQTLEIEKIKASYLLQKKEMMEPLFSEGREFLKDVRGVAAAFKEIMEDTFKRGSNKK